MKTTYVLVLLAGLAGVLTAEGPQFTLLGQTTQKLTATATTWDSVADSRWDLSVQLRPQFSDGPWSVVADSTWALPETASLTPDSPTVVIPEAYVRVSVADALDLTFGQKRYPLGVGQTVTVGDTINPLIGFFDQKTGFRGLTAEYSPFSWASLSGAVSTESGKMDDLTGAAQLSLLAGGIQAVASVVARDAVTLNPAVGVSIDLAGFILTAEGAAEFLPQGVRPEGELKDWAAPEAYTPRWSGSAGVRWTPSVGDWDLLVSAEVLHWALAWTADETAAWKASLDTAKASHSTTALATLGSLRAALPLRSQDNAFVRVSLGTGGMFSLAAFATVDLLDNSWMEQTTVTVTFVDNLDVSATFQTTSGEVGSSWEFFDSQQSRYRATLSTTYHF